MADKRVLCDVHDLPDPGSKGFECSDGREIFLVRRGAQIVAYVNSCPHTGGPLDWMPDRFLSADGEHIQCATHDAVFRIDDGRCLAGPCAGDYLTQVPLQVVGGQVMVELDRR